MDRDETGRRIAHLGNLVGNTPLLAIDLEYRGRPYRVWAKAENLNMTGSIKDRMALNILRRGHERGLLQPGATHRRGHQRQHRDLLRRAGPRPRPSRRDLHAGLDERGAQGAHREPGRPDAAGEPRRGRVRGQHRAGGGVRGPSTPAPSCRSQFENEDNVEAHEKTTGPEIWWQLDSRGLKPDAFVAGVGTGGTIMGVGRFLRDRRARREAPSARAGQLADPADRPPGGRAPDPGHLRRVHPGHLRPGILRRGRVAWTTATRSSWPSGWRPSWVWASGSRAGRTSWARSSSPRQLGPDATVVTVFSDDNKKYLSTDLLAEEPVKPGMLSPDVALRGLRGRQARVRDVLRG